jgi:hypothetical protein
MPERVEKKKKQGKVFADTGKMLEIARMFADKEEQTISRKNERHVLDETRNSDNQFRKRI